MREASIVIPQRFNDGSPVPAAWLDRWHADLIAAFGGFTRIAAQGGLLGPNGVQVDPVWHYIVAAKDLYGDDAANLEALTCRAKVALRQSAIYWRDFDGTVHIE